MPSRRLLSICPLALAALLGSDCLFAQPEPCLLSRESPEFAPAAVDRLHALPHGAESAHVDLHGQGLYGLDHLYLAHLAVFMGSPQEHPHNFQVILEVDLDDPQAQASYRADRGQNPTSLYTAVPEHFDQTALVADYPGRPALDRLPGTIVRGHFEQGGVPILSGVTFEIGRVVYFREFFLDGPRLEDQSYLLFGRGGELFGAHLLSAPPDFDQVLSLEVDVPGSSGAEVVSQVTDALAKGLYLELPERSNKVDARLRPGTELACSLSLTAAGDPVIVEVKIRDELYCESGEFSKLVFGEFNPARRCTG